MPEEARDRRRQDADRMGDGFGVPGEADHGKERARKADADCPHENQCNQVDDQEPVELRADMPSRGAEHEQTRQHESGQQADRKGQNDRPFECDQPAEHDPAADVGKRGDPACQHEYEELAAQARFSPTTKNCFPMTRQAGGNRR